MLVKVLAFRDRKAIAGMRFGGTTGHRNRRGAEELEHDVCTLESPKVPMSGDIRDDIWHGKV